MLVVIFSMIATTGWNAINSISGAAVLHAVSDGRFPIWAGVIVICRVSEKYLAAQQPIIIAAMNPKVTITTRGTRIAHGPRFCACSAKE